LRVRLQFRQWVYLQPWTWASGDVMFVTDADLVVVSRPLFWRLWSAAMYRQQANILALEER
jgi:hypothetical protein